jgi:hypothetical protein
MQAVGAGVASVAVDWAVCSRIVDGVGNAPLLPQVLSLANNQLDSLPDTIGELGSLTRLDLSTNNLRTLPLALSKWVVQPCCLVFTMVTQHARTIACAATSLGHSSPAAPHRHRVRMLQVQEAAAPGRIQQHAGAGAAAAGPPEAAEGAERQVGTASA